MLSFLNTVTLKSGSRQRAPHHMGATAGLSSSAPKNTASKLAVAPENDTEFLPQNT